MVNPFSWNTLADTIWIDQPVGELQMQCLGRTKDANAHLPLGTGFSTSDTNGYGEFASAVGHERSLINLLVADEDQMAEDFVRQTRCSFRQIVLTFPAAWIPQESRQGLPQSRNPATLPY